FRLADTGLGPPQFNLVHTFESKLLNPGKPPSGGWDLFNHNLKAVSQPAPEYGFFFEQKGTPEWVYVFKPTKCNLFDCPAHVFIKPPKSVVSMRGDFEIYRLVLLDKQQKKNLPGQVQAADRNVLLFFPFHFTEATFYNSLDHMLLAVDEMVFQLRYRSSLLASSRGVGIAAPSKNTRIALSAFSAGA